MLSLIDIVIMAARAQEKHIFMAQFKAQIAFQLLSFAIQCKMEFKSDCLIGFCNSNSDSSTSDL